MLKNHWKTVSRIERLADNSVVVAVFFFTYWLRDPLLSIANTYGLSVATTLKSLAPLEDYFVVLGFSLPIFNASLSALGAYRSMRLLSFWQLVRMALIASAVSFLCLGALLFILKIDLSRSFLGLFCGLCAIAIFLERQVVLALLRFFRARGKNFRNVLIAGTGEQAQRLYQEILSKPELGIRALGFVDLASPTNLSLPSFLQNSPGVRVSGGPTVALAAPMNGNTGLLPAPILATAQTFESALKRHAIDEVVFTEVNRYLGEIEELAQICTEEGIGVSLAADFFSLEILRSDISYFGDIPLIHYQQLPAEGSALVLKRMLDVVLSGVLLVLLSPSMIAVAIAIKLNSKGPVFFRQERVGLNGRTFTLLKFRSMVQDAEAQLAELRRYNEMKGPVFKMRRDPRVTSVGSFLRKYSIDELPQLLNVFRGDMSLVGPRPPLPEEVSLYRRKQRRRLSMRPGITCTWQVSGRNDIPDFEEWARMDLEYIDNWSLKRDVALLFQTIPAVFTGSGAR